jgi:TonB-linked SusC/RagA family outer membrane protein
MKKNKTITKPNLKTKTANMKKKIYLFLVLFATLLGVKAQDVKVTGTVTDELTGRPVESASVTIKGKSKVGATTNVNGVFTINASSGAMLVVSSVGFGTQEVAVKENLFISLNKADNSLADVVVVGYGTQKKANLTGSIVTIKNEDLIKRQVASTSNLLQGLAPGVTVQQQSGKPGADGAGIRIRGSGSFSASSSPLVLVDNVEMSLDAIDPNVIDNITILKDAASTAVFGVRATNGVILVTTKRAKKGTTVSYNAFFSQQRATNLPLKLTPVEHMELLNEARVNSSKAKAYTDAEILLYKNNAPNNYRFFNTDWISDVLSNDGIMQNHNISLSSGSEKIGLFASGTYLSQQGLTPNTYFKKFDFRINTDVKVNDKVTIKGDIVYNKSEVNDPPATSEFIIRQAIGISAIGAGKFSEGKYGTADQSVLRNPLGLAEASGFNNSNTPSLILKGTIIYKPIKELEFEAFVANNTFNTNRRIFNKQYDIYEPNYLLSTLPLKSKTGTSSISESYSNGKRNNYLVQGTFSTNYKNHKFKILAGFQAEEFSSTSVIAQRDSLINNDPFLNNAISLVRGASGGIVEGNLASGFGRFNYSFADKYLLEVNGRYDASSRFSQERNLQGGFFPSFSLGWIVSQENFFDRIKSTVNFFKLRGSFGNLGNQNIPGFYPFSSTFSTGQNYYFGGITGAGYAINTTSNPDISWETSSQSNIGIDLGLLKNKLTITADLFRKKLSNMLFAVPIPILVGQAAPLVNAGSMENSGWELGITYRNKFKDFKFDVTANISDAKNEVTNLVNQEVVNGLFLSKVGSPINTYYGFLSDGLFQSDAEVLAAPVHSTTTKAGDIRYKDISGAEGKPDGKIDNFDRTTLGNNFPRYEYSFNINASWRGFDLNVFFQGVGKRQTYLSGTGAWAFSSADFIATAYKVHLDRWTPSNPGASYPRLTDGTGRNFDNSDYWMKDGKYLRLKNLAIGYSLPTSTFKKLKVQQIRFYISGQNLVTWDNYPDGFDVEKNEQTGEFYPIMRTTTVGVNIRF